MVLYMISFFTIHFGRFMIRVSNKETVGINLAELLEIGMIVSFGVSWPVNVFKSYRARTAKGKSVLFLCLIFLGYIAGIASKLVNDVYMEQFASKWYVLFFYVLNLVMVGTDLCLYIRNRAIDKERAQHA